MSFIEQGRNLVRGVRLANRMAADLIRADKLKAQADAIIYAAEGTMSPIKPYQGTITRTKLYPSGGGNYRFAWRWLYAVNGVDIGTSLKSAESWAKQRGMKPVRAWEAA